MFPATRHTQWKEPQRKHNIKRSLMVREPDTVGSWKDNYARQIGSWTKKKTVETETSVEKMTVRGNENGRE